MKSDLIIVKVGTNVLTSTTEGVKILNDATFKSIGGEIKELAKRSSVILVSSGAITAGIANDGKQREDVGDTADLQRYAARGWDAVVQKWKQVIGEGGVTPALLTKHEMHAARTKEKVFNVLFRCLDYNDVFLVNENDVISDDEIKFGDNDTLAAVLAEECALANKWRSISLVLLTNVDGLYADVHDKSSLIPEVLDVSLVEALAHDTASVHGRGGMASKLVAAKISTSAGVSMYIANGLNDGCIAKTLSREVGTRFVAQLYV